MKIHQSNIYFIYFIGGGGGEVRLSVCVLGVGRMLKESIGHGLAPTGVRAANHCSVKN